MKITASRGDVIATEARAWGRLEQAHARQVAEGLAQWASELLLSGEPKERVDSMLAGAAGWRRHRRAIERRLRRLGHE